MKRPASTTILISRTTVVGSCTRSGTTVEVGTGLLSWPGRTALRRGPLGARSARRAVPAAVQLSRIRLVPPAVPHRPGPCHPLLRLERLPDHVPPRGRRDPDGRDRREALLRPSDPAHLAALLPADRARVRRLCRVRHEDPRVAAASARCSLHAVRTAACQRRCRIRDARAWY